MAKAVPVPKKSGVKTSSKSAPAKKSAIPVKKNTPASKIPAKKGVATTKKVSPAKTVKTAARKAAVKTPPKDMTRYRCKVCGYIYSPLRGEPHNGIPAGTPFEDLPEDYICPICGQEGKGRIGKWGFEEWRPTRYICSICDYVYDEKRGEPHRGIKPGTKFEDLPDDYVCPVCAQDPKILVQFGKVFKQGFQPLYV